MNRFLKEYEIQYEENFILENLDIMSSKILSKYFLTLPPSLKELCTSDFDWTYISDKSKVYLSMEMIENFKSFLNFKVLAETYGNNIPEYFIEQNVDKFNIYSMCYYVKFSEHFIEKYQNILYWTGITYKSNLSEPFMEKFSYKFRREEWNYISRHQKLSEKFIEKYENELSWMHICEYQELTEQFMDKFKHKLDWNKISIHQKLSEEFIENNAEDIQWYYIFGNAKIKLSNSFMQKYDHKYLDSKKVFNSPSIFQAARQLWGG